jgi:hypothetical protein
MKQNVSPLLIAKQHRVFWGWGFVPGPEGLVELPAMKSRQKNAEHRR